MSIYDLSKSLQMKLLKIDNTKQWNINELRYSEQWKEILELSDEIKKKVYQYQRDVWGTELDYTLDFCTL